MEKETGKRTGVRAMVIQTTSQHIRWEDFPDFMRRLRRRRGLSQERLAQSLGCDRTYICKLENGRNRPSAIFLHNLFHTGQADMLVLTAEEVQALEDFASLRIHGDEPLG